MILDLDIAYRHDDTRLDWLHKLSVTADDMRRSVRRAILRNMRAGYVLKEYRQIACGVWLAVCVPADSRGPEQLSG